MWVIAAIRTPRSHSIRVQQVKRFDAASILHSASMGWSKVSFFKVTPLFRMKHRINLRRQVKRFDSSNELARPPQTEPSTIQKGKGT